MKKCISILTLTIFLISFTFGQNLLTFNDNLTVNKNTVISKKEIGIYKKKMVLLTNPPTIDKVYIDFVGSGDIQKSISKGDDISANTGIGVIFERYSGVSKFIQSFELEGTLNVASTADSIEGIFYNNEINNRRDFGTYVLNPISAKQSLYVNSNVYFGYPNSENSKILTWITKNLISGVNLRLVSSNNVWSYGDSVSNLGSLFFRGGIFKEFVPDNYRLGKSGSDDEGRSKYSIFLGLNYSYRGIFGDITSERNNELRGKFLGSEQKIFRGFELNFGFRLNNLRAEFQMPVLRKENNSIDGLTNTQFLFSIKFVGGFSLKLNSDKVISEEKGEVNSEEGVEGNPNGN